MASNFGDYMYSLLFAPLRKVQKSINQWAIFFSVIGKLFDDTKQDVFRVRSESMIVSSSEPVLELHGLDRGMVRLKGETVDNYRIRLAMKYIIASEAGTNKAILYVAKAFGYDNVSIERNTDPAKWAEATVQFIGGKIVLDDRALLLKELNKIKPASALLTVSKEQRYTATIYQGTVRVIGRQMTISQGDNMAFTNLKLTTFGQNLDAKCKLGKGLHLSRVVIGDGLLGNGSMVNRIALVSERFSMLIDAKQLTDEGAVAAIIATLDNSSFTEGFSYRELGLMGVDPDTSQEGLYLYDNAGEECEYLDTRANGVVIYERLKLLIKTQDAASITFDPSGNPLYIGVDDPVSNNTVTFTQAEERAEIQSGETLAVLFGKVKKWLASLGSAAFTDSSAYASNAHASSHATGGSDPLTPAQIGAATAAALAAHTGDTTAHLTAAERTAWNGKANTVTLTCTVPVSWTASGDYFYQNVSVPGMLAADNPVADILPGSDNAANKLYAEAWGKVLRVTAYDGGVQIWCTEAPTVAFPAQFKVVR